MSTAAIARSLNERGVPSPGMYDRRRNSHRLGSLWTVRTVAAILANPRYTGRQVWNRQFTDHREALPGDKRSSRGPVRVWNPRSHWVISAELTHPPLISDADFLVTQQVTALSQPDKDTARRYALTSLLVCGICGRRLEGHWAHQRPTYRCRHGHNSARSPDHDAPRWVYWSQANLMRQLPRDPELAGLYDAETLASYLRARDTVIVCGLRTLTIEAAILDEAGTPVAALESGNVQLELPIPSGRCRRRGRSKPRNSKGRISHRRRRSRNPRSGRT